MEITMNVAQILQSKGRKVITVTDNTTLIDVSRVLAENKIGSIVVVDASESVVGIISERDIVRVLGKEGVEVLQKSVSHCMTSDVITCNEATKVDEILAIMSSRRFRHMPVLENNQLVGIISIGDVVKTKIAATEMEAAAMRDYITSGYSTS